MKQKSANDAPPDNGIRAVYLLYIGFFLVWCAGLALGELWTGSGQPMLWGMPAWFMISCVFSSIGVSVALILCVWRYFK